MANLPDAFAAEPLPEFAFREIHLKVTQADGEPVSHASIYGFCGDLNLLWPRRDVEEFKGRNDILWHESFLGKTGPDGTIKATLPPGRWGFFALGQNEGKPIVVAWSDFNQRTQGEEVAMKPVLSKNWILCSEEGIELKAKQCFFKPDGFPVWLSAPTGSLAHLETSSGRFQLWATGDATANQQGFALSWGMLSNASADGKIMAEKSSVLEFKGGKGKAELSWHARANFGLEGEVALCNDAKVRLVPGLFTLAYRRPITDSLDGYFVGQCYNVRPEHSMSLELETPLTPALDQTLSTNKKTSGMQLVGQLYLVDGNGHILSGLVDDANRPVNLQASVVLDGQEYAARLSEHRSQALEGDDVAETMSGKAEQMVFAADIGNARPFAGAVWEFAPQNGGMATIHVKQSERVRELSSTFNAAVPTALQRNAKNVLFQAELLAQAINNAAGKRRKIENTTITIIPGRDGAVAAHDGSALTIGTQLFFYDAPMAGHTIVHELGHDYGFHHGGLHETVVEVARCAGASQITEQTAKWMFIDRMNGLSRPEVPFPHYPNVGLYLYAYAQGGIRFLHFVSANEARLTSQLGKQGYSKEEITTALLSLALNRNMTRICSQYGLNVDPNRVSQALKDASAHLASGR